MKKRVSVPLFFMITCLGATLLITQVPFDRMDGNGDGKLSKSEFKGPPGAFNRLDKNNDGFITREEAKGTRLLGPRNQTRHQTRPMENTTGKLTGKSRDLLYVDTHNHLVGPRKKGKLNLEKSAAIALEAMDASGVKLCLLMPMPQAVNQKLHLYLEDILPIVEKYPSRFAALGGGGTLNVMIQQAIKDGRVSKELEKKFDLRAAELVKKGAVGFGEMTAEHFSMSREHPYEAAPPDHPLFLRLADLAAKYDRPIDLHMEAIPVEMPMPSRFKSPPNPKTLKPNIAAFKRLLAHNRNAEIIWVHLGWDNTGKRTVALTRQLLSENPNLYMSLRIAAGMMKRGATAPTFPLDADGRLTKEWLELLHEFPKRFLIGGDEIIKPANNHPSAGSIQSTAGLLEQLPTKLKQQIGWENAYRLYRLKKR